MSPQRPSSRGPRRPPPKPWWEIHAKKLVLASAAVAAAITLWNYSEPVRDSRLPSASQNDVKAIKEDVDGLAGKLGKAIDNTLEVAKAANQAAQQSVQFTNDARLDRLLKQRIDIEDQLKRSPNDATLKTALARTNIDIAKLTGEVGPAAGQIP